MGSADRVVHASRAVGGAISGVSENQLVAPFPYFGGKRVVAPMVWREIGDVGHYIEPFFGSGAVMLARPSDAKLETINDADGMVVNFWRAVKAAPDAVAEMADWPVMEQDLHARHAWLVQQRESVTEALMGDPDWFDAKVAGWWVWGACAWIGSGWCSGVGPWQQVDGRLVRVGNSGQGINKQLPHLGDSGKGINKQLPHLGDSGQGINNWLARLSARLRRVRIAAGDWSRVCGDSIIGAAGGTTGVFLDPPYSEAVRKSQIYAVESGEISAVARQWAIEHGDDPRMRIALCGYDNEHGGQMPDDWRATPWKATGGYGSQGNAAGRENASREVIWFSPHCLGRSVPQRSLF